MVRMVVVVAAGALMLAGCGTLFDLERDGPPEGMAAGQAAGELLPAGGDAGAAAGAMAPDRMEEAVSATDSDKRKARPPARAKRPAVPSDAVRAMQLQLTALGYEPGPPDGFFGPLTRSALKRYQQDRALTADGKPTQLVMQRIAGEAEQGSAAATLAQGDGCMDETRRRAGFLRAAIRWIFAEKASDPCGMP